MDRLFIWNILGGELENKGANSLRGEKKPLVSRQNSTHA